jgi:hypothetical protein
MECLYKVGDRVMIFDGKIGTIYGIDSFEYDIFTLHPTYYLIIDERKLNVGFRENMIKHKLDPNCNKIIKSTP